VKLDELRDRARSGLTNEEPKRPNRQRRHVQEMDLNRMKRPGALRCEKCSSDDVAVTSEVDLLANAKFIRATCRKCGAVGMSRLNQAETT